MSHPRTIALISACLLLACGDGPLPIPADFDAPFAHGHVCMPAQAATGSEEVKVPVRFDFPLYRCLTRDGAANVRYAWACQGTFCELTLLGTAHMLRVDSESGCDGRDMEDPPEGEFTESSVGVLLTPPKTTEGEFKTGAFTVRIPYLTLDDAEDVLARIDEGQAVSAAVQSVVGVQRYAGRDFQVNFDPGNPTPDDPDALAGGDCHAIPLP